MCRMSQPTMMSRTKTRTLASWGLEDPKSTVTLERGVYRARIQGRLVCETKDVEELKKRLQALGKEYRDHAAAMLYSQIREAS